MPALAAALRVALLGHLALAGMVGSWPKTARRLLRSSSAVVQSAVELFRGGAGHLLRNVRVVVH